MILTPLQDITAYRMHVPKWAVAPTSGAGAARAGGRANRIGTSALYLALEVATAVAEYQQLSPLLPPGTLVSYRVTATPVVDFTSGYRPDLWPPLGILLLRLAPRLVQRADRTAQLGAGRRGDRRRCQGHPVSLDAGCGRHEPGAVRGPVGGGRSPGRERSGRCPATQSSLLGRAVRVTAAATRDLPIQGKRYVIRCRDGIRPDSG